MPIKFAIIIPAYKAHDTIHRALNSIQMQTRAEECKVFVIDDCDPTKDYYYLQSEYKNRINLEVLKTPKNGGPSAARNVGIQQAIKQIIPYILFVDADDMYYSPLTVEMFHKALSDGNYDFISSNFLEQVNGGDAENTGNWIYYQHQDTQIWLFGKLYKTRILQQNNIRFFSPSENEDVGFNLNYSYYSQTSYHIPKITYLWRWSNSSITRVNDGNYSNYCILGLYKNCLQVHQKFSHDPFFSHYQYKKKTIERMIMMFMDWNLDYATMGRDISKQAFEYMCEFYNNFYKPLALDINKNDLLVMGAGIFKDTQDKRVILSFADFIKQLDKKHYKELYTMAIKKGGRE